MNIDKLLQEEPYSLEKKNKEILLTQGLAELTEKHYSTSPHYQKMMDAMGLNISKIKSYYDIPFLPVRMFKELELRSVPIEEIVKTMTSSGTSGQPVSYTHLTLPTKRIV